MQSFKEKSKLFKEISKKIEELEIEEQKKLVEIA